MASKFEGLVFNKIIVYNCFKCLHDFRSKTVSEDENTTTKDMMIADKLVNVCISCS